MRSRVPSLSRLISRRVAFALFAAVLGLLLATAMPVPAWASNEGTCCVPSDEQIEQYKADGTYDQRVEFFESLGQDKMDPNLIQAAIARQQQAAGISSMAVPSSWSSGMPTSGTAKVLVLYVDFQDKKFAEGDTPEALASLFDGSSPASGQYENLRKYYQNSSFGALTIDSVVKEYHATKNRDEYTSDIVSLFHEAMKALDGELNYADFDGNEDGLIDCVYIHFAGGDASWGTSWWSYVATYQGDDMKFDGVSLSKYSLLHEDSNTEAAAHTLIHETGHVLGLPDYYSYKEKGVGDKSGIATFDMMYSNNGDHNGFSKWMLGWVDEQRITHIQASDAGIVVKEGTAEAVTYPATETIESVLSAYTSDTDYTSGKSSSAADGNIIVVSNQDTTPTGSGLFSSFYMLQYDRNAGNQKVSYTDNSGVSHVLPTGFRVYRVQASLNSDGSDFLKSNTYGSYHNQLIEFVDIDGDCEHNFSGSLPWAMMADNGYNCSLVSNPTVTNGDTLSPTSEPASTNFYESKELGFTGLTIKAVDTTKSESGTVQISYSDSEKPEYVDLELTPKDGGASIGNMGTITLEANTDIVKATDTSEMTPYLLIPRGGENEQVSVKSVDVQGRTVTMPFATNPEGFEPGTKVTVVVPAGYFIVGYQNDVPVYNSQLEIEYTVGNIANLLASGYYEDTVAAGETHALTNVFTDDSGAECFLRFESGYGNDSAYLYTMANGVTESTSPEVTTISGFDSQVLNRTKTHTYRAQSVGENRVIVAVAPFTAVVGINPETALILIDTLEGKVLDSVSAMGGEASFSDQPTLSKRGDSLAIHGIAWRDGTPYAVVDALTIENDKIVQRYVASPASSVMAVGSEELAFKHLEGTEVQGKDPTASVSIYNASDIEQKLANGYETIGEAMDNATLEQELQPNVTIQLGSTLEGVLGFVPLQTGYGMIVQNGNTLGSIYETSLVKYNAEGVEQSREVVPVEFASFQHYYSHVETVIGKNGTLAVTFYQEDAEKYYSEQETLIFDANGTYKTKTYQYARNPGIWLEGGNWYSVGWDISPWSGSVGSPDLSGGNSAEPSPPESSVHYLVTEVLDTPVPSPDTPTDPTNPGTNEPGADDASKTQSAKTSDALPLPLFIGLGVVAAAALAGIIAAIIMIRKK